MNEEAVERNRARLEAMRGVWSVEGMRFVVDWLEPDELGAVRESDGVEVPIGGVLSNPAARKVEELPNAASNAD